MSALDKSVNAADDVASAYNDRVLALLERIREICSITEGIEFESPYFMDSDSLRWEMSANIANDRDGVNIAIELAEARDYGDDPEDGVAWRLDIVEYGGRILGGMAPYNYTDECWVSASDASAVAERWSLFEDADLSTIPDLILNR